MNWKNDYSVEIRYTTPPEVEKIINDNSLPVGGSEKVIHSFRRTGSVCSEGKDAALSIVRQKDCYLYYCHRCGESGKIFTDNLAPSKVVQLLEHKPEGTPKVNPVILKEKVEDNLPKDLVNLAHDSVPGAVISWINQFKIYPTTASRHKIGWSEIYNRIIFPLFHYTRQPNGLMGETKLMGWTGRDIQDLTKEERKEKKIPKYISRKCDQNTDRLYFLAPRTYNQYDTSPIIIVEDIISAIKICQNLNIHALALLNADLPYSLISNYRGADIYIWLDYDMRDKALKFVKRFTSLGFKMSQIVTEKDPKYITHEIMQKLVDDVRNKHYQTY